MTEEERALLWRQQQKARSAYRKAANAALAGNEIRKAALVAAWEPMRRGDQRIRRLLKRA